MCTISRFLGNLQKIIIHIKSIGSAFPAVTAKVRGRSKRQKIRPLGHAAAAASPQPGNAPGSPPLPRMDDPHGCSELETQSSTCHPTAQWHTFLELKMHGINGGWGPPSHVFNNSSSLAAWLHRVCYPPLWLGRCPRADTTQLHEDFSPFSPLQHPTSSSGWQLPWCVQPLSAQPVTWLRIHCWPGRDVYLKGKQMYFWLGLIFSYGKLDCIQDIICFTV